jgi:hypothetical protein
MLSLSKHGVGFFNGLVTLGALGQVSDPHDVRGERTSFDGFEEFSISGQQWATRLNSKGKIDRVVDGTLCLQSDTQRRQNKLDRRLKVEWNGEQLAQNAFGLLRFDFLPDHALPGNRGDLDTDKIRRGQIGPVIRKQTRRLRGVLLIEVPFRSDACVDDVARHR